MFYMIRKLVFCVCNVNRVIPMIMKYTRALTLCIPYFCQCRTVFPINNAKEVLCIFQGIHSYCHIVIIITTYLLENSLVFITATTYCQFIWFILNIFHI